MTMFAGLDVGFKRTAVCVVDGTGRTVWRGVVDTHPEAIAAALKRWRIGLERVRAGDRIDVAMAGTRAWRLGLSGGLHGCASGGGCGQEPAGEVGQGGCICAGGDAANRLVQRGTCEERREPSAHGGAGGDRGATRPLG